MSKIRFANNEANQAQIAWHLRSCDAMFIPALSTRVDLDDYAVKLLKKSERFEAWLSGELVGLVATYCNDPDSGNAFITNVSILPDSQGTGVASRLLDRSISHMRQLGFERIKLNVGAQNHAAIALYEKLAFTAVGRHDAAICMELNLQEEEPMDQRRDYNAEINDTEDHQYAYSFDFDVMHGYMLRTFEPFFRSGNLLELGSFKGDFTRRLLKRFDDITCVEASSDAIAQAEQKMGREVEFVHSLFETASLPRRYDNIVMTHVLEHLDDPVRVLKRVNDEWLAEGGRFFLVCPNANAPSRQIAVKMGLISHNAAVTPAESEHGHLITYSLDTLERDAVAAGLRVVHRSGIFFKALANFQWDRLLQTDIISPEYLEGCYQLGQIYPELCSSIFLVCESTRDERAADS